MSDEIQARRIDLLALATQGSPVANAIRDKKLDGADDFIKEFKDMRDPLFIQDAFIDEVVERWATLVDDPRFDAAFRDSGWRAHVQRSVRGLRAAMNNMKDRHLASVRDAALLVYIILHALAVVIWPSTLMGQGALVVIAVHIFALLILLLQNAAGLELLIPKKRSSRDETKESH